MIDILIRIFITMSMIIGGYVFIKELKDENNK